MSTPHDPPRAKLIASLLAADATFMDNVAQKLETNLGALDYRSPILPFDFTDYYHREMGDKLVRQLISFTPLRLQDELKDVKLITNRLENDYRRSPGGDRRVNIDPGLLSATRLVLATGKDAPHRIYLGSGIFADLTLVFERGDFRALPWTYPDYRSADYTSMLAAIRKNYLLQLKKDSCYNPDKS